MLACTATYPVTVILLVQDEGALYLALTYAGGGDLSMRLEQQGHLDLPTAQTVFAEVGDTRV